MLLKAYQTAVLDRLSEFLRALEQRRREAEDFAEFRRSRGQDAKVQPFCAAAWGDLAAAGTLPAALGTVPQWIARTDGLSREVPHACIKLPTGGGKTLVACHAVGKIAAEYMERQAGLVVWVVPSDAIIRQTLTRLSDPAHPYRLALDAASGGRVRILRKGDAFTARDIRENLCVLVIMLQSTARTDSEALRVFRDSGGFASFFPVVDDDPANRALVAEVANLDRIDLVELGIPGVTVRHSLANVLRLCRPILVVDEGHRAYTDLARDSLLGLNPSFVLELTATPNGTGHRSNVLVAVSGTALKSEEMIKLPINVHNLDGEDWRGAVTRGLEILGSLASDAEAERRRSGRQVRPIMLIRVEATGRDRRDGVRIHANDVREFLETRVGIPPEWVRTKTAAVDELGDDDLLAPDCQVRVILTKDALREGWDCPFAYVLVVLSNTTGATAITQMIGRVLRQPGARYFDVESLNGCYVVCTNQEVRQAVMAVRQGLEMEGMVDLAGEVRVSGGSTTRHVIVKANPEIHPGPLILPVVAIRDGAGFWREYKPERDLMPRLDWSAFSFRGADRFTADRSVRETVLAIALQDVGGALGMIVDGRSQELAPLVPPGLSAGVRHLLDVVPNAWHAARILRNAEAEIVARGIPADRLAVARPLLAEAVYRDIEQQVDAAAEAAFRTLVLSRDVALVARSGRGPGVPLPDRLTLPVVEHDQLLVCRDGTPLRKNAFEAVHESGVNTLESDVIRRLDGEERVQWWHRVPVQQDWSLVGWRRNRIYPDLVAVIRGRSGPLLAALETKGAHLAGNPDTEYKRSVFDVLAGAFLADPSQGAPVAWVARILQDPGWEADLADVVKS